MTIYGESLQRLTTSSVALLTVAEAKAQCAVESDFTDDDALFSSLIEAATRAAEDYMRRSIIEREWRYQFQDFPRGARSFRLPRAPLIGVQSITFVDTNGERQELSTALYSVNIGYDDGPGRVELNYGYDWPIVRCGPAAVGVDFTAGYAGGSPWDVSGVPASIVHAVRMMIAHFYANREAVVIGGAPLEVPLTFRHLLDLFVCYDQ